MHYNFKDLIFSGNERGAEDGNVAITGLYN